MKIKTLITLYSNGNFVKPSTVMEMDDAEAKVLIARKFAIEADFEDAEIIPSQTEKEVDQATRQIGQPIETASPESLVGSTVQIPGVAGDFTLDEVLGDGTLVASPAQAPAELEAQVEDVEDLFPDENPVQAPTAPAPAPVKPKGKGK